MEIDGLIIGGATFLIIGAFHPLVIKAEYHWGSRCWWLFLMAGCACIAASVLCHGLWSVILGVAGFSCLWSIHEIIKQRERVDKGWFPAGPGHKRQQQRHKGQNKA